ncbi:MAG: YigZ family protein [Rudaea sp.]
MSAARLVLAAPATLTQEIRKSRFVARARRVASPDDALASLDANGEADATHNCWAYRIGQQYRFNDDGEPSGTAGKPILQAIDSQGLDETLVIVMRWFGGIKLGAGGLVRAYGGCAAECLRIAQKEALVETVGVACFVPFSTLPLLQARLAECGAEPFAEAFSATGVELRLRVPRVHVESLRKLVADATRGRSALAVLD